MNKKFLSAILFGALMVTSTGTFVSCKDYDDDIENLQTQIDKNSSAIAELQKLVGQGKWVSSISSIENGFTVTMSDGSSVQIKGINGKDGVNGQDGKNGAEWTIGADGFWYVDGEKTENVAVGKNGENGKNGVSAPSPFIGTDGNWVVYAWDAEKGEFVEKATEIPAAGTSAYAVKADGIYTLYIADADGEMQEIVLPATTDAFVAAAPASNVYVSFEQANWKPVTTKADKEIFAKMTKEFPALAEYKKGDLMMQGGNLPVIITPANVELTNEFKFSLQNVKGEVSEAKVSNPVKGMPEVYGRFSGSTMHTRSAEANDAFWTLSVEPAKNKKGDKYVPLSAHSLVVENAKGTVVKTPFAYSLNIIQNADVTISTGLTNVDVAEEIDVLAKNEEDQSVFTINHGLNGYYLLEATDILEIEKYGITIEGSKLMIANMPADQTSITVDLKLTAVGLNGSVEEAETTLTIGQAIAVNGTLSDKVVTLGYNKAKNNYNVAVRWNIADELKDFSATQLNQFLYNTDKTLTVKYEDEEGEMQNADPASVEIKAYDKKGVEIAKAAKDGYKNAVTFGFDMDSQTWEPGEYVIRLEVETAEDAVIYAAEAVLTVENPELGEADVKLVPGFVDENGVYQITGNYSEEGIVTYSLENALILNKNVAEIINIFDKDYNEYSEEEREDEAYEMCDWVPAAYTLNDAKTWTLKVNKWAYANDTQFVNPAEEWSAYVYNQLYQTRNIRAMLKLFGNDENVVPFDFQVEVKSEIYAEDAKTAITIDEAKLVNEFGAVNVSGTDADESVIDIKAAITKAVSVAGTDKGKTYPLFATTKSVAAGDAVTTVYNYSSPKSAGGLLLKGDNIVKLTKVEYLKMCDAFGVKAESIYDDVNKYELTVNDWTAIWGVAQLFYNEDGSAKYRDVNNDGKIDKNDYLADTNGDGKNDSPVFVQNGRPDYNTSLSWGTDYTAKMAIYNSFKTKIDFNTIVAGKPDSGATQIVRRDSRIASLVITFDEPAVAAQYFQNVDTTTGIVFEDANGTKYNAITIKPVAEAPNSVTGGQVKVGMTLTIRDAWGMIMELPFEVTVKTAK